MNEDERPIVVEQSPVASMIVTGARQVALVVGGASTAVAAYRQGGVGEVINWISGDNFATFTAAAAAVAAFGYGQYKELRRRMVTVKLAQAVPDAVAVVVRRSFRERLAAAWRVLF